MKLRREAKEQHRLQNEYDKIKFRLKCMDIELHTEVSIAKADIQPASPKTEWSALADMSCQCEGAKLESYLW